MIRLLAACLLLCAGQALAAPIPPGAFVRVAGTRFVIADPQTHEARPFFFVGANFNPMHGERERAQYRETITALVQDGMTVGRVWALGEGPPDAIPWSRKYELFRAGPEGYIEDTYQQLDRVLAEARQQGLRLILTLSNNWKDYGGLPRYLRWVGLSDEGLGFEEFYKNPQVKGLFRAGLLKLLGRRNTVTGVRYVDDPTIFSWELMNESLVLTSAGAAARRQWIVEAARLIREYDKNHLIAPGLLGYESRAQRAEWVRVHQLPEVDYCDSHLYPQDSGQVDSLSRLRDFLDDRAQLSRFVVRKPLVIGEFGFKTDVPKEWLGRPRAAWFDEFLGRQLYNGGAGALVWIYEPFSGKPRNYGIYTDYAATDDVRAVLRRWAGQAAAAGGQPLPQNPRLAASHGDSLLYEPYLLLHGAARPHSAWRRAASGGLVLEISPIEFAEARFERAGSWGGPPLVHAYGGDSGHFVYRFRAPFLSLRPAPAAIRIEARLSSEWPGAVAPPDGGSPVRVLLDGQEVGHLFVIPDNGLGRLEQVILKDPARLARFATGVHTLTFEVPDVPQVHGLCIYGVPGGQPPPPKGDYPPLRIRYLSRASTTP